MFVTTGPECLHAVAMKRVVVVLPLVPDTATAVSTGRCPAQHVGADERGHPPADDGAVAPPEPFRGALGGPAERGGEAQAGVVGWERHQPGYVTAMATAPSAL